MKYDAQGNVVDEQYIPITSVPYEQSVNDGDIQDNADARGNVIYENSNAMNSVQNKYDSQINQGNAGKPGVNTQYNRDTEQVKYDAQGYVVDDNGKRKVDAQGYSIDTNGNRVDAQGNAHNAPGVNASNNITNICDSLTGKTKFRETVSTLLKEVATLIRSAGGSKVALDSLANDLENGHAALCNAAVANTVEGPKIAPARVHKNPPVLHQGYGKDNRQGYSVDDKGNRVDDQANRQGYQQDSITDTQRYGQVNAVDTQRYGQDNRVDAQGNVVDDNGMK